MFEDSNCSKEELIKYLEGKKYTKWNPLEDLALTNSNTVALEYLRKTRSQEEIEARAKFLEIKLVF